jgi:hypothetical protein
MKKILIACTVLLIVVILTTLVFDWGRREIPIPDMNQVATSTIANNTPIIVSYPIDNQTVTSPIHINGTVQGNWFFEGTFPVELIDSNGDVIGSTTATTDGDWATTSDVYFSADISYRNATTTDRAFLLLENDNPSGDPAHLEQKFIPLILK